MITLPRQARDKHRANKLQTEHRCSAGDDVQKVNNVTDAGACCKLCLANPDCITAVLAVGALPGGKNQVQKPTAFFGGPEPVLAQRVVFHLFVPSLSWQNNLITTVL